MTGGFLQAAARAIAHDRIADLLRRGKACPGRPFCRLARDHLDHKARPGGRAAVTRTQKIAPHADARGAIWILQRFQCVWRLSRQALAATRTAAGDDLTASLGGHAGAETVTPGADEFGRLECTFHGTGS